MKPGLRFAVLSIAVLFGMIACSAAQLKAAAAGARSATQVVDQGCVLVVDLQLDSAATRVCDAEKDLYPLIQAAVSSAEKAAESSTATPTPRDSTGAATVPDGGPGPDPNAEANATASPGYVASLPASRFPAQSCPTVRSAAPPPPAIVVLPGGRMVPLLSSHRLVVDLVRERHGEVRP